MLLFFNMRYVESSKLCSCRLIAALSRDLLVDFILFLPRIADSLASLLQSGADREPEIIEQIFISWSYIMMYLQKYLIRDLVYLLKKVLLNAALGILLILL
ncbi:uncharacterized protein LOC121240707 [Juglans microcarpa x Juglans regia]|uniref:uncharacterized protein LOC121240707 n=1 Tax=Juglans microcarpa x Juglans regia TaxID=2249226 RepID=UPI001B7DC12B|nr:uncharacterized protein LOC121240707 [Juglans microcarpa x Juglans regia]